MADKKISELILAESLNDEDAIPVVQGNLTKKIKYKNIREVAVNPTQPATNERVWIKKGKNLLNVPFSVSNKKTITATKDDFSDTTNDAIYLEAGKTYTLSFESDANVGTENDTVQIYLLLNKEYNTIFGTFNSKILTFSVTVSGYYYLRFDVNKNGKTHSFWNIQIEQGAEATTYETYIEKEILIKNDNGVFENFVNVDNLLNFETVETW